MTEQVTDKFKSDRSIASARSPLFWWQNSILRKLNRDMHKPSCYELDLFWESLSPQVPASEFFQGQAWAEDARKRLDSEVDNYFFEGRQ
jgi:hypothetical protein